MNTLLRRFKNFLHAFNLPLKALFVYIFAIILCVIAFSYRTQHVAKKQLEKSTQVKLKAITSEIEIQCKNIITTTQIVANNVVDINNITTLSDDKIKALSVITRNIMYANKDILAINIALEPDNKIKYSFEGISFNYKDNWKIDANYFDSQGNDFRLDDWYIIAKENKQAFFSEPYILNLNNSNKKVFSYSIPLMKTEAISNKDKNKETFLGVVSLVYSVDIFKDNIERFSELKNNFNVVVSKFNRFIAHPIERFKVNESIYSMPFEPMQDIYKKIKQELDKGNHDSTNSFWVYSDGQGILKEGNYHVSFQNIPLNNWKVITLYSEDYFLVITKSFLAYNIILSIAILLLVIVANALLFKNFEKEVRIITAGINSSISNDTINHFVLPTSISNITYIKFYEAIKKLLENYTILWQENKDIKIELRNNLLNHESIINTITKESNNQIYHTIKENEEIQINNQKLIACERIARILTKSDDLKNNLIQLFEKIKIVVPIDVLAIFIEDEEKNQQLLCKFGTNGIKLFKQFHINKKQNNEIISECYNNKEEILINDISKIDNKYIATNEEILIEKNIQAIFCVPIFDEEKNTIGVLTLQSTNKNIFRKVDRIFFDIIIFHINNAVVRNNNNEKTNTSFDAEDKHDLILETSCLHLAKKLQATVNRTSAPSISLTSILYYLFQELEQSSCVNNEERKQYVLSLFNKLKHSIIEINENNKYINRMLRKVLQDFEQENLSFVEIDLNDLVQEYACLAYNGFRAIHPDMNIKLEFYLDNTLTTIKIIPKDISIVIINLVNNACYSVYDKLNKIKKNTTEQNKIVFQPTVTVYTESHYNAVSIIVRDNGNGISEENKAKLFTPFFSTKSEQDGVGLGLTICYNKITKNHKGEINVNSTLGESAQFTIILPKSLEE